MDWVPSPTRTQRRRHKAWSIAETTYLRRGRKSTMKLFSHPSWLVAFIRPGLMILPQTRRCAEIKMFGLRLVCAELRRGVPLSVPRWQLKRESMFANLYSYLIWNECRSHSLLVTETGVNTKAKWTNRWLVCELLYSWSLSVLLLICLIMHAESLLQLVSDWSCCVHVCLHCSVCLCVCVSDSFL